MKSLVRFTASLVLGICLAASLPGCGGIRATIVKRSYPLVQDGDIKAKSSQPHRVVISTPFALSGNAKKAYDYLATQIGKSSHFEVGDFNALAVIKNEISMDIGVDCLGMGAQKNIEIKSKIEILTNKKRITGFTLTERVDLKQTGGFGQGRNVVCDAVIDQMLNDPSLGYGQYVVAKLVEKFNTVMVDLEAGEY